MCFLSTTFPNAPPPPHPPILFDQSLKPSFIYVNSLRFFANLRPFKPPALVGLMCFSECVIRNKLVIIIIVITVMKNGFINV